MITACRCSVVVVGWDQGLPADADGSTLPVTVADCRPGDLEDRIVMGRSASARGSSFRCRLGVVRFDVARMVMGCASVMLGACGGEPTLPDTVNADLSTTSTVAGTATGSSVIGGAESIPSAPPPEPSVAPIGDACSRERATLETAIGAYFSRHGVSPGGVEDLVGNELREPPRFHDVHGDGSIVARPGAGCE